MADLHTDDWLDARFDAAVDDLDRVLATPRRLTSGDFRRHARRHNAGRAALAVGMVGGTLGALAFVARDPASPAPVASPTTEAAATSAVPANPPAIFSPPMASISFAMRSSPPRFSTAQVKPVARAVAAITCPPVLRSA